jgi:hypothetical protein
MATRDEQSDNFLNSDALSDEFFNEIIERKLGLAREKFKVRLVTISPATGKNENYLSVVYRAKIKIEIVDSDKQQCVDVIIKAMTIDQPELKEWSIFPREIFIYNNVISSFERIWKEEANEVVVFGPKCLKFATEPYELMVLDDLKAEGYQMLNRKVGVNVQQAKLVLSKLAKFHAASAIRLVNVSYLITANAALERHATYGSLTFHRKASSASISIEDLTARSTPLKVNFILGS